MVTQQAAEDDVERLLRDHVRLSDNTAELIELVDRAADVKSSAALGATQSAVHTYVARLRAHMQFEESVIFPRAVACLATRDWNAIETHLSTLDDPLFGPTVDSDYRVLYEYFSHRARAASQLLTRRGYLQLDSFIMSADALESGLMEFIDLWQTHASNISRESRHAADKLGAASPTGVIAASLRFGVVLTREFAQAGSSTFNLYFRTLWNMAQPFVDKNKR